MKRGKERDKKWKNKTKTRQNKQRNFIIAVSGSDLTVKQSKYNFQRFIHI